MNKLPLLVVLMSLTIACNSDSSDSKTPDGAAGNSGSSDAAVPDVNAADMAVDASAADGIANADATADAAAPIFMSGFEDTIPPEVAPGGCTLTPSQGYAPLGPPGNQFGPTFLRCETGVTITLTLTDLPPHTSLSIAFLFAAIDSLDGTGDFPAGDFFHVTLDDQTIFRESFANATADQIQSYVPPPGVELARRVDLGFSGPGGFYTDSAYNLGADPIFQDLPHTASTAVVKFNLEGAGVQSLDDESWAIDNVYVTTGNTPRIRDIPDGGTKPDGN